MGDSIDDWAAQVAAQYLEPLGNRWKHVQAVAQVACALQPAFSPSDGAYLLAAAYLHDVGYAPELVVTGFHPLDGAIYLRSLGMERLACLVAHHSGACFEAELRGLAKELAAYPRERSAVADALTYCDQMCDAIGRRVTFRERQSDIHRRYGSTHIVSQASTRAYPSLTLSVARTVRRLKRYGISVS